MVPLRAAQFLFAILVLALNAYGTYSCAPFLPKRPAHQLTYPSCIMVQLYRRPLTHERQLPNLRLCLDNAAGHSLPYNNASLLPDSSAQIQYPRR
jgi:hypothetical protein